jgi:glycosyltransferase involved in cell wall biosynthesis
VKTRFRILHCLRAPVGGLFRHVCDLAIAQREGGHAVGVVCADDGNSLTVQKLARLEPHLDLGLHRLGMQRDVGLGDARATMQVGSIARRIGCDILHGHGAKGGAYARLAPAGAIERYYTPHGGSLHYGPETLHGRLYIAAERFLARRTGGLIFESDYSRRRFETLVGTTDVAKRVIPNGVLDREFEPVRQDADAAELLFIGELRHLKGVDVLLTALHLLHQHGAPRPRLVVVGDGPDRDEFVALAARLGLETAVSFPGAMSARQAFALGRLLVVPSRAESFPYIVLEAGAAGLPMIASKVGGIPEIVADTPSVLVPPGDAEALALAIASALADPGVMASTAAALRERVRQRFTVAGMARDVIEFYRHRSLQAAA